MEEYSQDDWKDALPPSQCTQTKINKIVKMEKKKTFYFPLNRED